MDRVGLTISQCVYTIGSQAMHDVEIYITESIARKLRERHNVSEAEVLECFRNKTGRFATDVRSQHQTDKPTVWFIAETDKNRRLKVVFIRYARNYYINQKCISAKRR
jgi:hypothetical protein